MARNTMQFVTSIDGQDVQVDYNYYPGLPAKLYGDNSHPAEAPEVEILSVFTYENGILGEELFLDDDAIERLTDLIMESDLDYADDEREYPEYDREDFHCEYPDDRYDD